MSQLENALRALRLGFKVFPCHPRSKKPAGEIVPNGVKDATHDEVIVRRWWSQNPDYNPGVTGGTIVDCDHGLNSNEEAQTFSQLNHFPATLAVRTGRRDAYGVQFHFAGQASRSGPYEVNGVSGEVRAGNLYGMAPGAIHPDTGETYKIILDLPLAPCPSDILAKAIEAVRRRNINKVERGEKITHPGRHDWLVSQAGRLFNTGVHGDALLIALRQLNQEHCEPPKDDEHLRGIVRDADEGWEQYKGSKAKPAIAQPEEINRTDAGNAQRFLVQHSERARYCGPDRRWYVWDGGRWAESLKGEAGCLAMQTARSILVEAAHIENEDERNRMVAWAMKSLNASQITNMLKLAGMFPEFAITQTDLDADPWLLTVANGTIDLHSGALREHRHRDLISKLVPITYDPTAACPTWEEHLKLVLPDDATRAFFQRATGYSLTGLDVEEVFFFLQGGGQNGKSKTLEILASLLGDYAWTATFGAFVRSHNGVPLNVIADLKGRRFVVIDEGEENQTFNESLLKNLTGGSSVAGRQLYSRTVNYRPTFKLWFGSNYKPSIQGMDLAIWRRVRLIPFGVKIPDEKRDKFFSQKLTAELPGILNWALAGLAQWRESGLGESEEVKAATRAYRSEMDTVKEFIEEQAEQKHGATEKLTVLYDAFRRWSERNGNKYPFGKRAFAERLRRMSFQIPENGTHAKNVTGIQLKMGYQNQVFSSGE